MAKRVAVAMWQSQKWIGNAIAVILSGDKQKNKHFICVIMYKSETDF
jgi:hypothetical protein